MTRHVLSLLGPLSLLRPLSLLGPKALAMGLVVVAGGAQVAACGSRGPVVPSTAPETSELAGSWGLTVEAHRHTGKRYGMPANELLLDLGEDGKATWRDLPEPVWVSGAEGVLGRVEGSGTWSTAVREGRGVVEVKDAAGGVHVVGILGSSAPWTLALEEVGLPLEEAKRLELTRVSTESL